MQATIDAAAQSDGVVSVLGEIATFGTKALPIPIVRKAKPAGEKRDEDEIPRSWGGAETRASRGRRAALRGEI